MIRAHDYAQKDYLQHRQIPGTSKNCDIRASLHETSHIFNEFSNSGKLVFFNKFQIYSQSTYSIDHFRSGNCVPYYSQNTPLSEDRRSALTKVGNITKYLDDVNFDPETFFKTIIVFFQKCPKSSGQYSRKPENGST